MASTIQRIKLNECMLVFTPANTKQINTHVSYERIYPRGTCIVACVHLIKSYSSTFSYYICSTVFFTCTYDHSSDLDIIGHSLRKKLYEICKWVYVHSSILPRLYMRLYLHYLHFSVVDIPLCIQFIWKLILRDDS